MTPPPSAAWGIFPPGTPRDAHVTAAESMLGRLATAFPRAGLGMAGSVSTATHHPESDLDLVVVDPSFRRDMQFATVLEGVRTALLCLEPGFDAERERRWLLASGADEAMLTMVRTAVVARDPAGCLGELQRTVARLDGERLVRRDELMAARREHVRAAMRSLREGNGAGGSHAVQLALFAAAVDGWFLREGLAITSKQERRKLLETIAGRDPALAALLRQAIPITPDSLPHLLRAVDHVFGRAGN